MIMVLKNLFRLATRLVLVRRMFQGREIGREYRWI